MMRKHINEHVHDAVDGLKETLKKMGTLEVKSYKDFHRMSESTISPSVSLTSARPP